MPPRTADLVVTGMTCAACQANVQRALARVPGVTEASVNLMTGQTRVQFDPALAVPGALVAAVDAIGYGASLSDGQHSTAAAQQGRDRLRVEEYRALRLRAVGVWGRRGGSDGRVDDGEPGCRRRLARARSDDVRDGVGWRAIHAAGTRALVHRTRT
jgi:copper chaperone CopZ